MAEKAIVQQSANNAILQNIQDYLSKLSWKHAIIAAIPITFYIYPWPILKLFMPIVTAINNSHYNKSRGNHIKQIILTSNELVTFDNIQKMTFMKGQRPKISEYRPEDCKQLQLLKREKKPNFYITHSQAINKENEDEDIINLSTETIWLNFRLTKIQNPNLKVVLIKASQAVIHGFLVKFYNLEEREVHKFGKLGQKKMYALRLDQRFGTYQQFVCEFDPKEMIIYR